MNPLKDIIQRCHERHANPLRQRKTVAMPSMFTKGHFYQYRVYCAHNAPVLLDDLEIADISFMPIGRAPENDRGPRHFGGELFRRRTKAEDWGFNCKGQTGDVCTQSRIEELPSSRDPEWCA